jgi:hypothetical protein
MGDDFKKLFRKIRSFSCLGSMRLLVLNFLIYSLGLDSSALLFWDISAKFAFSARLLSSCIMLDRSTNSSQSMAPPS